MEQFIDASFNKDFTQHYSLLMELEKHQLAFVLYDNSNGKIAVLKRITFPETMNGSGISAGIKNIMNAEDLLHLPVKETKIALLWPPFSLIPSTIFDESKTYGYLNYHGHFSDKNLSEVNSISSGIRNVFSIDKELKKYLQDSFQNVKLFHSTTSLLEYFSSRENRSNEQQLILNVRQDILHIAFYNNDLKFCNSFTYFTKEDFTYFVLLVCDQLQINRETCSLNICGYITDDSMLYKELYKFFRNISFIENKSPLRMPKDVAYASHYYTSLFSLHLCAS